MSKVRELILNKVIYQSYILEDKVVFVEDKEKYQGLQSLEHFENHHCQPEGTGTL